MLTPEQVTNYRGYADNYFGGGQPFNFGSGGFSLDPTNSQQTATDGSLAKMLGAAQSMGLSDADIAQVFGPNWNTGMVDRAQGMFTPDLLSAQGRIFNGDTGIGIPSLVRDQYQTTRNADGSYTDRLRTGTGSTFNAPGEYGNNGGGGGGRNAAAASIGNPYLDQIAGGITQQVNQNLSRNIMPAIADRSISTGGLGGSRQGVAQGLAIEGTQNSLASQLAQLYGGAYESQANRDLSKYGIDTNAGLQQQSIDNSFYTAQRGQDLSSLGLGAELWSMGQNGPWGGLTSAGNILNGVGSQSGTTTNNTSSGGGANGALGGGLLGWSLWNQLNK